MTIIDELLILLDDLEQAESDTIPTYFDKPNLQIIFSSLGRLVNRGWVQKNTKRQQTVYSISSHGVHELNRTLDCIKNDESTTWDKRWHLVVFDIPESKRKLRDNFRNFLRENCYGKLTSSVWISPWDKTEEIKRFQKRQNLNDNVFHIRTEAIEDNYQSMIFARQSWDWKKIEQQYRDFINLAQHELNNLPNNAHQRFQAKQLVFRYAEVLKLDPQLPIDITPNGLIWRKARDLYIKIRPYCLKKS